MIQCELLVYALLTFAEGHDASTDGGHMLADGEVDALDEGGVDLPAVRGQHLLNSRQGTEDHPMAHPHQAPSAYRLDHLRIEQTRQRHPAWLGREALHPLARRLDPLAVVRQQRRRVLLAAIGEKERDTA